MCLRSAQTHENNKIYLFILMDGLYFELLLKIRNDTKNYCKIMLLLRYSIENDTEQSNSPFFINANLNGLRKVHHDLIQICKCFPVKINVLRGVNERSFRNTRYQ